VVAHPLRAREDHVVVGHRDDGPSVHLAEPADEAVRGRARDQLLARAPLLLGSEQQRPVLDEAALIQEVGQVLPGGPFARRVTALDGLLPCRVEPCRVTLEHRLKVRARPGRRLCARLLAGLGLALTDADVHQRLALGHRVTRLHLHRADDALGVREHLVLHLHRLEHDQDLAFGDMLLADAGDLDDDAGERRGDRVLTRRAHRQIIAETGPIQGARARSHRRAARNYHPRRCLRWRAAEGPPNGASR